MARPPLLGLMFIAAAFGAGCRTTALDMRGSENSCQVHSERMREDHVPVRYGLVMSLYPERDYAGKRLFPNASRRVLGGCVVGEEKTALVLYCEACRSAERAWDAEHPFKPRRMPSTSAVEAKP